MNISNEVLELYKCLNRILNFCIFANKVFYDNILYCLCKIAKCSTNNICQYIKTFFKYILRYYYVFRGRIKAAATIAEIAKTSWKPKRPASVHWDGKIMASLTDKYEKDDRLPVLVSSRSGFKLLGAPALPVKSTEATGDLIGDVTYKLLSEWSCTSDICSMVFDTTNSNTGQLLLHVFKYRIALIRLYCGPAVENI